MLGLAGKTLDRYVLEQRIGKGGMADVYFAYDPHFQRAVAIKIFKQDNDGMLQRFMREAKIMADLHHPHLMSVYDMGESEIDGITRYYIVMPFVNGGTLGNRIRNGSLSLVETSNYLHDIASALDYIHQHGIIHRDIKSTNVLLSTDGLCYLSDLGVARLLDDVYTLTSTGNVLGTVDYIAPELFIGNNKADASSDIYSLGVLLFEMVTGQRPFAAENQVALASMHVHDTPPLASSLVSTISPAIEQVILHALEKDPAQRFPTAIALADAFYRATKMRDGAVPQLLISSVRSSKEEEVANQVAVKEILPALVSADSRASATHHVIASVDLVNTPLPPTLLPGQTRKNTVFFLLIILLFGISVPSAWFLGQMHTAATLISSGTSHASIFVTAGPNLASTATFPDKTTLSTPVATTGKTDQPSLLVSTPVSTPAPIPGPQGGVVPNIPSPTTVPVESQPASTNLIQDPGYELEFSNFVESPWSAVGAATIDYNSGQAQSGKNAVQIVPATDNSWADVRQVVSVQPNTTYTLSVYIHTSDDLIYNMAVFDVNGVHGSNIQATHYGPSPFGYHQISLVFNSGSYTAVTVRIGFTGTKKTWVQADDWSLHT